MYKKMALIAALSLSAWTTVSLADTCPSVSDIKSNKITGWTAFDSDDGKQLSPKHLAAMISSIDQFALAEWVDNKNATGTIHCYYRDKHGSDLEAYFAKSNFAPDNSKTAWYKVSGYMHCAAGSEQCAFNDVTAPEQQLASK